MTQRMHYTIGLAMLTLAGLHTPAIAEDMAAPAPTPAPAEAALAAPPAADMAMPADAAPAMPMADMPMHDMSSMMQPAPVAAAPSSLPKKGETMAAVEKRYGAPKVRHKPVGGDSPVHPPITRWDYDGYSVFFENRHVVSAVVPGSPPPLRHEDQLRAATP